MPRKTRRQKAPQLGRSIKLGPLTASEIGNDIVFESKWDDPSKHAEFIAEWVASRPKIKAEIDDKISRAIQIVVDHDPIHLLSFVSFEFAFDKVDQSGELEPAQDFIAEYALGLCSAFPFTSARESPSEQVLTEFGELLRSIFMNASMYFGIELAAADADRRPFVDLRVQALLKFLFQRGDTHRYYQYDFIRNLYGAHDGFFRHHFRATLNEALAEIKRIAESAQLKWARQQQAVGKLMRATELVADAVRDGVIAAQSIEDIRRQAHELPEIKKVLPDPSALVESLQENPFEIDIDSPQQREILERLSIGFGDNQEFATFEKSPGWPTNSGRHTTHPVIKNKDRYYAFVPQMVWRNLRQIFDGWIETTDSSYFKDTVFHPKKETGRSRWLERESVDLFRRLLPGCRIYQNVFYDEKLPTGEVKQREIDALIEFDGNVLIVSAKSGEWSIAARRGAPGSMAEEITQLLVEGFEQGWAAKRYIETNGKACFTNDHGVPQITFDATTTARAIYVVNVTLSPLGPVGIQLNALKKAGLLAANDSAWSVFVNDLRAIADLCASPSEFLFYLQRRLRFNLFEQLHGADELDLFGYFLDQGLFFDEERLKGVSRFSIGPNTEKLDRYFDALEKSAGEALKPALAISSDFRDLIRAIERTNCDGFSEITLHLLNLDGVYHEQINTNIASLRQKVKDDEASHHATIVVGQDLGVTIELRSAGARQEHLEKYCVLKKYQLKVPKWMCISVAANFQPSPDDRSKIFIGDWVFDPTLEAALEKFREHKLKRATASGRKIGRNEQCPCGSGLKYKNCCGRITPN